MPFNKKILASAELLNIYFNGADYVLADYNFSVAQYLRIKIRSCVRYPKVTGTKFI